MKRGAIMYTRKHVLGEALREGFFLALMGGLAIFVLSIMGCGHGPETAPVSDGQALMAKTIPDASCVLKGGGDRVFCNGIEAHAMGYDCGTREGRHCFYFVHYADADVPQDFNDTVCHLPDWHVRDCPAGSVVP